MLVLSRKLNERILIGENITITVCYYRPDGGVVIGIDAPRDVTVLREELVPRVRRERPRKGGVA